MFHDIPKHHLKIRVENMAYGGEKFTSFEVFGNVMKHGIEF